MVPDERVYEATRSFLDKHPETEQALDAILEVEASWSFDEIDMDSGRFGELVAAGIVDKTDDGSYRIADKEAVRAALAGEALPGVEVDKDPFGWVTLPAFDLSKVVSVGIALAAVASFRSTEYGAVMRGDTVVSPGNDPYFYRYMQRQLLEISTSPTDLTPVTDISSRAATRPLTHAANWWLATLLGGTPGAADTVAAWLPIIGSVALGLVLYLLAVTITDDARIGIATVLVLAVLPVHAVYTRLGFLEHRVHQYFWLGVMVLALAWLAVDAHRRSQAGDETLIGHTRAPTSWAVACVLAVSVAASVHAWRGSALIFVPVAMYVGLKAAMDVREGISPVASNIPLLGGLAMGSLLAYLPYTRWGWHQADTVLVITPALVTIGAIGVIAMGALWLKTDYRTRSLVAVEGTFSVLLLLLFRYGRPDDFARLQIRVQDSLLGRDLIVEAISLYTPEWGVVFGPLVHMGLLFYVAVIVLGWATWVVYRRYEPGYLVPVVFGWYFAILAGIQVRFAAQLSLFIAFFAAIGIVYTFAAVDLARRPSLFSVGEGTSEMDIPERLSIGSSSESDSTVDRTISLPREPMRWGMILLIGVLLFGLNVALVPSMVGGNTYDVEYDAVQAIEAHATAADRTYPDTFVLSQWGQNRMYNFFVSGDADSYAFAQREFATFINIAHPDDGYEDIGDRVGYVVVTEIEAAEETAQYKLYHDLGLGDDPAEHFQLVFDGGEVKVFALVEGAVLNVTAEPDTAVTVATEVTVDGTTLTYERTETVGADGSASIRVPYPGTYEVGGELVTVPNEAVEAGTEIHVDLDATANT